METTEQTNRIGLVTLPISVMTYDIDYAQIVHNAVYIRWLEDLRTALIRDAYSIEELLAGGISPILTRTTIEYRLPVRFGDDVLGAMWVAELERTRWTIEAEITVGGELRTWARQQGYFADLKKLRPVRVPERLRALWRA